MKTIAIVNQKGGCGKTITAVNLSAAIAKQKQKVLLIDLDPQSHASFAIAKQNNHTIADVLESIAKNKQQNLSEDVICQVTENLFCIPSSLGLASLEQTLSSSPDKLNILEFYLKQISSYFDYCILDCPPNLGLITLNALSAARYAITPLNTCELSLRGVDMLKSIFVMLKEYKGSVPTPFYLLNQVDLRSNYAKNFVERIKGELKSMLFRTQIRTNTHLREAAALGKNIFEFNPKSRGAEDFTKLAQEIQKLTSLANWTSLFLKGHINDEVYVVGDFNNWQKDETWRMRKTGENILSINLPLAKGNYRYKFLSDNKWFADPHNNFKEDDSLGSEHSVLMIE